MRIPWNDLTLLLRGYFPKVEFFSNNNLNKWDNIDKKHHLYIENFVHFIGGQWTLDLVAMARSKYSRFFHKDFFKYWNAGEAKDEDGIADVIKFFIDRENDEFWKEFSSLPQVEKLLDSKGLSKKEKEEFNLKIEERKNIIRDEFLRLLKYDKGNPVWECWDFSDIIFQKPSNVFDAFKHFAHGMYTLLRLGFDKVAPATLETFNINNLLKEGSKILYGGEQNGKLLHNGIIDSVITSMNENEKWFQRKQYLYTNHRWPTEDSELEDEWESHRNEYAKEILDSLPDGISEYIPKDEKTLTKRLKGGVSKFKKTVHDVNHQNLYDHDEIVNIKNYMEKIDKHINDKTNLLKYDKIRAEYKNVKNKSYEAKVIFLFWAIQDKSIRELFKDSLEIIKGLFLKDNFPIEGDKPVKDKDGKYGSSFFETIEDEKQKFNEDLLSLTIHIQEEFKELLDGSKGEKFQYLISEHFKNERYRFRYNANKIIITENSIKLLFDKLCKVALGIPLDNRLREQFKISMKTFVDNYEE